MVTSSDGVATCEPCPTGCLCAGGTVQPISCPGILVPAGYYLPANSTTPTICPAGGYCPGFTTDGASTTSNPRGVYSCATGSAMNTTLTVNSLANLSYASSFTSLTGAKSRNDCYTQVLLYFNGATGGTLSYVDPVSNSTKNVSYDSAPASIFCKYNQYCVFPSAKVLSASGYAYCGGWQTSANSNACTTGTRFKITTTAQKYYATRMPVVVITLNKNGGGSAGTSQLYTHANTSAIYLESNLTKQMTPTDPSVGMVASNPLVAPTQSGMDFKGYYSAASGGIQLIDADGYLTLQGSSVGTQYTTWYAHWDYATFEVSYNLNGGVGTVPTSAVCEMGGAGIDVPDGHTKAFGRPGYRLIGWSSEPDLDATDPNIEVMLLSDVCGWFAGEDGTAYAVWKKCDAGSYSVAYGMSYADECTLCPSLYPKSVEGASSNSACYADVPQGSYLDADMGEVMPCGMAGDGYYCPGGTVWNGGSGVRTECPDGYDMADSGAYAPENCYAYCPNNKVGYTISAGYDYYGGEEQDTCSYMPNNYAVTYSCGDGTGTAPASATATYDSNFTPAANTCTRTGYSFAGWAVSGTSDVKAAGVAFKWTYLEKKTFTATWNVNSYNCAPGKYLDGVTCKECTGANYCEGGTWPYDGAIHGLQPCPSPYNSGADAGASAQSQCYWLSTKGNEMTPMGVMPCGAGAHDVYCPGDIKVYNGNYGGTTSCPSGYNEADDGASGPEGCYKYCSSKTGYTTDVVEPYYPNDCTYTPINYTITYNLNGGTNYENAPTSYTIETTTITLGTPTRANSTFAGWYTEAAFTNKVTQIAKGSTGNKTFYAKWTCNNGYSASTDGTACNANVITLNFANGGRGTAPTTPANCTYGNTFTMPSAMTATGYTFGKWSVNNNTFDAGATVTCNYANLGVYSGTATITGTWTPNTYNVTYSCGDGTGTAPASATATYDSNFTPAANTCTRTGYSFAGWAVSGTSDVKAAGTAFKWTYLENKTFTATWNVNSYTCAPGKYLDGVTCKDCTAGHYCEGDTFTYNGGVQGLTPCSPGTYNPNTGSATADACVKASKGYYVPTAGASEQIACSGPRYADKEGQTQCTECPTATNSTGVTVKSYGYWNTNGQAGDNTERSGCNVTWNAKTLDDGTMAAFSCYVDSGADTYGVNGTSKTCWVNKTNLTCNASYYNIVFDGNASATQYTGNKTLTDLYANVCQSVGTGYWSGADDLTRTQCPANYQDGAAASSQSGCQTKCAGGTYVASANNACTSVGTGYYKAEHYVNYGSTSTRSQCPTNYQVGAAASSQSECQTKCAAGTAVLTANNACATIQNATYKGKYTTEHFVNYGSKSSISTCPTSYQDGNGTTAQANCVNSCAAGTQVVAANADCSTPSGTTWYTAAHDVTYGKTSSGLGKVSSCNTGYATANTTTATDHDAAADCKISCSAGYYIPTAGGGCKVCTAGKYCSAISGIAQTSISAETGNVTAGYWNNGCGTNATGSVCSSSYSGGTITDGCYGSAGATTACPNNCNALTAPAVTGGTFSSATPRSANTACRYVAPSKTATGCSSITANMVSYSGSAWGTNFYTTKASKGYRVSATGNTANPACAICAAGTYQGTDGSTATSCTNAADGKYVAGTGASADVACALGSYSEKSSASTKCVACPAGRTTSGTGTKYNATANTACSVTCANADGANTWASPSWTANSVANLCKLTKCNANTYYTAVTASGYENTCTACGSNSSTSAGNTSTACTCTTGYTSTGKVGGASTSTSGCSLISDIACSAGQYVPAKATSCSACTAGYYCPSSAKTYSYSSSIQGRTPCAAGKYQPDTGKTSCIDASAGYYVSGTAQTAQTACTGATYQDATGQAECKSCPTYTGYESKVLGKQYWIADGIQDTIDGCQVRMNEPVADSTGDYDGKVYCQYLSSAGNYSSCWVYQQANSCAGGYYYAAGVGKNTSGTATTLAGNVCKPVEAGYWSADASLTRTACASGLVTCGSGTCANEAGDCGRKLHVGNNIVYLRSVKRTTPSLNVKIGSTTYYGNMSTSVTGPVKVNNAGTKYSVVDDYQ